jgi:hypothetical protein
MPRKRSLDANGLRQKKFWPHLPEPVQQELIEFLAFYRAVAESAALKAAEIADIAREDLGAAENSRYWTRVVRSIDWLLHRVPMRQRYLEIRLAKEQGRWQPPEPEPAT